MNEIRGNNADWPNYQLILFRFFTIYFVLSTAIWSWLGSIPGFEFINAYSTWFSKGYTYLFNDFIYTVKDELVPTRGSGDTSMGWATIYAQFFYALVGTVIWSILDRKRKSYFWLSLSIRNVVRYYIIIFAFIYGIIKVFGLQMPSPSPSYYATDLGNFSAMRFSWNFVGYSKAYQFFSGFAEVLVGVLLLYRRTVGLGALLGIGVFSYVFLLNMTFDIPVKIFSFQLLLACVFISITNLKRILNFFVLNRQAEPDTSWDVPMIKKWFKPTRLVLKLIFIGCFAIYPFYNYYTFYEARSNTTTPAPFESGYYSVTNFILNGDTIPADIDSKIHWKDLAIDNGGRGSIGLLDSAFRISYGRSYFFNYSLDSATDALTIKRFRNDSIPLFVGSYASLEDRGLQLNGIYKNQDTLQVDLFWDKRDYKLEGKEFNWLQESVP
ncbi:hypothetical protein [Ekhidna sp.]